MKATSEGPTNQHERVERLFEEALQLDSTDRSEFVRSACGTDASLAAELLSLLEHARPGEGFFKRLAEVLPPILPPAVSAGRYEVQGLLGAGGMGAVYRAHDTQLDRAVALKFLPPHLNLVPAAQGRLLAEARAAARLEHVNVCTVYEVGETDERWPFIAMALYQGETLKSRLARGSMSLAEVVDVALQVTRGLAAAHAQGIVHRDVKPGNVMLTEGGVVKLLDFGLATMSGSHGVSGATPGTVPYMSPEQTHGAAVSAQSDLWSLGVVMYEMLTGVRPFGGTNNEEIIRAIREGELAPLRERTGAVPESLERIVERLLEKEGGRRYQSVDDLLADLTQERETAIGAAIVSRVAARPRRLQAALFGALLLGAGAGTAWWSFLESHSTTTTSAGTVAASAPRTLAILPFGNVDRVAEREYLSEGLTEELTTALSRFPSIRVVSRASASTFVGNRSDLPAVGRALKVSAILAGTLELFNGRLRVRARLVNVEDGSELWSKTYDDNGTGAVMVPHDVVSRIASALAATLSPSERNRPNHGGTSSQQALASYLKGRYFSNQRTAAAYRLAKAYFEQAIAADTSYGAPWAGLATVYGQQGMSGQLSPREAQQRARAAALRAVTLDSSLAEAHAVLGIYLHAYDWDSEGADQEFQRAIALDPSYATARHYYGVFLRSVGRFDEAIAQESAAVELDPLVAAFNETLAFTLLRAGRADEALARVKTALELDSTYWRAHAVFGNYFEVTGRYVEAIREYERANQLAGPAAHRTTGDVARALALTGRKDEARHLLATLQSRAAKTGIYDLGVASAYHALGDDAAAYDWLEQTYRQRQPELRYLVGDTRFRTMSTEPRFVELLGRLRLPH